MFFTDDEISTKPVNKGVDIKSLIVKVRDGYQIQHYSDDELLNNVFNTLGYDVECYENYVSITFCNLPVSLNISLDITASAICASDLLLKSTSYF